MKKITDFIVEKRNVFLILFIFLAGISIFFATKVNINEDIMKYLPASSETKIGNDIMTGEFREQDSSILNVMFKGLSEDEKETTLKSLEGIQGVSSVDYEKSKDYNIDDYTLYVLNVDDYKYSDTATKVYESVHENFDVAGMSGSIYDENKPILHTWIVAVAIICAMIILIVLSESYVEPFLYLITIGIAVFINKGTNIMFNSVSSITDSITAILQLALSMDYSIMLSNRFKQEKEKTNDKIKAMKNALYESFKAISSSSVTTIVGLIALVFMSFTIGKDLGLVLSKGVLLSLVCIFLCLPGMLLLCDNLIHKTHKKSPHFNLEKLGKFSYKTRWFQTVTIIVLFVLAYFLQGKTNILYTDSEQDLVGAVFPATNQIAIVYENKYEELMANYCKKLEEDKNIDSVLCYSNTINEKLTYDELNAKLEDLGQDTSIDDYLVKIIYYNYFNKNEDGALTVNDFLNFIRTEIYTNENFEDVISDEVKENLDLLANFATPQMINKKRSVKEISSILDMDESDAKNILIYYNSKHLNTKITIKQFVDFMLNDVAKDPDYSSSLDTENINSLKTLQKFTNTQNINKKMNAKELSNMFGIDEDLIEQLLLFSRIKTDSNTKLTFNEFATTALDLANDKNYKSLFDKETIDSLTLLKNLSDARNISKKLNSYDMGKALNSYNIELDSKTLSLIYVLYDGYNTNTKLTFNEFATIALDLAGNPEYKSLFNEETTKTLQILKNLSSENVISINMPANVMSEKLAGLGLNIDEEALSLLYILENGANSETKMTLNQFASVALSISKEENYKAYFNDEVISTLEKIVYLNMVKNNPMSNDALYSLFGINDTETISILNNILQDFDGSLTPNTFIAKLLDNELIKQGLTSETINALNYALFIMNDTTEYSVQELADTLNQDYLVVSAVYGINDAKLGKNKNLSIKELIVFLDENKKSPLLNPYVKDNTKLLSMASVIVNNTDTKYTMNNLASILSQEKLIVSAIYGFSDYNNSKLQNISVKDLINFIYMNRNNSLFSEYLRNSKELLNLAHKIVNNTSTKYSYIEISSITETDKDKAKQIYSVYDYQNYETILSPLELTDLILNNLNDEKLKGKLDNDAIDELDIVKKVMINTLNNNKVSSSYVSDLLGIDNDTVSLLFSLYDFKYTNNNSNISLYNYIDFIIKDVMNNKDFADKFDQETKNKLTTISSIMNKALNNEKYNSLDLYGSLRVLNKDLDKSLVELVYLYNNSINNYDESWSMTVEEIINYLNSDILNDDKFTEFIDEEMKENVKNAKDTIEKSKQLIVSDKYSRAVLNTKYPFESEETFNFINNIKSDLQSKEGIYIVGNSSMAVEMSQTFNDELNKITLLTMIFIFVVVAFTFKDILIPLILVLVIQCAVYITMSFISVTGGSVYFISLLIVQAILMGATIDYAIVYTSYYKESRLTMGVKDAIINSYNKSIHTILSSSLILIIVTLIVANFASAIAAKICETISQGAFTSAVLILLILPGILASVDKIICRDGYKKL